MQVRVLGSLEVWRSEPVPLPNRRNVRLLLAVLALRDNVLITTEWLVNALWAGRPPRSAAANLRSYLADLRRLLRTGGESGPRLETGRGGLLLRAGPAGLDALAFDGLRAEGSRLLAGGRAAAAVRRLAQALELWRGPVLDGLPVPEVVQPAVLRLEEHRVDTVEDWVEARLATGGHAELAGELPGLTAQYPLRERLWSQRMLALYRCGRQAEALAAYQELARLLDAELGVPPTGPVRELHGRMLAGDPVPLVAGGAPVVARGWTVPRELPAAVPGFVGRDAELADLDRAARDGAPTPVTVISGTAGVGKTALALHWAHLAAGRYPDGVLYADLRGYAPDRPADPGEVLAGFLTSLGLDGRAVPLGLAQRAARYRTLLAERRLLVVLDNARDADQVRPLLAGAGTATVLVTSRDALAGLVARDGAHRIVLDLLPPDEAATLVRALVGPVAEHEPDAVAALAEACGRLPLALRVAAELAARADDLTRLAGALADERRRLDLLDAGDPQTAVRAVFSWSYRQLPGDAARLFRLLGLHPAADPAGGFGEHAAAALAGTDPAAAREALAVLTRANLLHRPAPGRYGLHDLLAGYARTLAEQEEPAAERRAALTRLLDASGSAAAAARDLAHPDPGRPDLGHPRTRRPRGSAPLPELLDADAARRWLDAERATLVALAGHAARHGWPRHAVTLGRALGRHLHHTGQFAEALRLARYALDGARELGDPAQVAGALRNAGHAYHELGRYPEAIDHYESALRLHRAAGDADGEAVCLTHLGSVLCHGGRYAEAARHFWAALRVHRAQGALASQAQCLTNLGTVSQELGRYADAVGWYQQALRLHTVLGTPAGEAATRTNLAAVHIRTGHPQRAVEEARRAVELHVRLGGRAGESHAQCYLGQAQLLRGRHEAAREALERALEISRETGERVVEAAALNHLGSLDRALGRRREAVGRHERALEISREVGELGLEAEILNDLAATLHAAGDTAGAADRYAAALAVAGGTGARHAQARALAGLGRCDPDPAAARASREQAARLLVELGIAGP